VFRVQLLAVTVVGLRVHFLTVTDGVESTLTRCNMWR
jgi:hypothetical protein